MRSYKIRSASPASLPAVVGESSQLWMLIKNVSSTTLPLIYITATQVSACKHGVSPLPVKCKSISAQQTVQWTPSTEWCQPTCVFHFLDAVNTQRDLFIEQLAKSFSVKQKQMFLWRCVLYECHTPFKKDSPGVPLEEFLLNQPTLQCHEAVRGVLVSLPLSVL